MRYARVRTLWTSFALSLVVSSHASGRGDDDSDDRKAPLHGIEYRLIGPAAGGRVCRVAGVPGDRRVAFAATAASGVWRTTDGGREWEPVFDEEPVSSIGSIAIAPSDPSVVWIGTGEANVRGNVGEGNGIYRSDDGGDTWQHVWTTEGQIGTIAVHPGDSGAVFAAVLGSPFGPGEDRGVYRTIDNGETWTRSLYVDADTGASDVCIDPANPLIVFAGTWQVRRTPWNLSSGGPGSGLWRSEDGGDAWKRLGEKGLPSGPWGRVGVSIAQTDSSRVYALIEAEHGGLFRSDDGGESWRLANPSRGLRQRAWYYSTLTIDPTDADRVWFPQVNLLVTQDGGDTLRATRGGGWDYHDVWIDPLDPNRIVVGSDAGVSLSDDGGASFVRPPLPLCQLYHVSVDSRTPYRVLGSVQDLGTVAGPSNNLAGGDIRISDWHGVGGGEAGHVVADPTDPDIVWAGEYLGFLSRYDGRLRNAPNVGIDPDNGSGHAAADLRYRFQWTAPIVVSPHDSKVVYHAANVLFRTRDAGQTWTPISPDLTRDDKSKQQWSGGPITGDNTGVEFYCTIFSVAESPLTEGVLWVGTDDGLVHITQNGGRTWVEVTPPDLPAFATVVCIEPSRFAAGTAWVVADAHRLDDETPYLWQTTDYGQSWQRRGPDLDAEVYLHVVREDSRRPGMLYLGAERGVMLSRDDGATFESLRLNMPTVAIADLAVAGDDLVVGSLGRSIWILDDLTPLRETTADLLEAPAHLFQPLPAVRWHQGSSFDPLADAAVSIGANPEYGALINYHLRDQPAQPITLEIIDAAGQTVRRLSSELEPQYTAADHPDADPEADPQPALAIEPGFHRVAWDLAWDHAHFVPGSRTDTGGPGPGPIAAPGDYLARLTVDGTTYDTAVTVRIDPRSKATSADLQAQVAFLLGLRDRMSTLAERVERLRAVRSQVAAFRTGVSGTPGADELLALAERITSDLDAIEGELHNPTAEVGYDILAGRDGGAKLYSRFGWLADGALPHDGPPTQGMRDVAALLSAAMDAQLQRLDRVLTVDVRQLNDQARRLQIDYVRVPAH